MAHRKAALSSQPVKKIAVINFLVPTSADPSSERAGLEQLHEAVAATLSQRSAPFPLESLYRTVETTCANPGKSEMLYSRLRQQVSEHLHRTQATLVQALASHDTLEFLGMVGTAWVQYCEQMLLIRSVFGFLDRTYALKSAGVQGIWELGLKLFLTNVLSDRHVGDKVLAGMLSLIENERRGQEINRGLLKSMARMLRAVGTYFTIFEAPFLERTETFYREESARLINELEPGLYLAHVDRRLREEAGRVEQCLDGESLRPLQALLETQLVRAHLAVLFDKGLPAMVAADRLDDLRLLCVLVARINALEQLRDAFRATIKAQGGEIVMNSTRDKSMVEDLLAFKQRMDAVVAGPFARRELFVNALKDGFETFVNMRHNKPAEMLAKYMDAKLRTGYKDMSEEDLEALLDRVLIIFRFVNGKDVFEAFYKALLAKRLLLMRSASDEMERAILLKLKAECGGNMTAKMEGMMKDVSTSRDITQAFRTYCSSRPHLSTRMDFAVSILTLSNWPSYAPATITLPPEMHMMQEAFQTFYSLQHSNRRLTWQPALGSAVLRADFPAGSRDLHVSQYQAAVLLLFAANDTLTYAAILEATRIDEKVLKLTLLSLACGLARVLTKEPKGKEVSPTDIFSFNTRFKSQHKRVKINQIQIKETEEEQEATHEKVFQDRQFTMDAAIVRIMKMRKTLKYNQLVTETINQLKFPIKTTDLKKRIESLIEREYLERDPEDQTVYKYVA